MEDVLQLLAGGLAIGCVYSLIALGFSMSVRAANLINFAQGDLAMIGAFFGLTFMTGTHLPYLAAFVLAIVCTGVVGLLMERLALRPILNSQSPPLNLTIAVLGLSYAFRSIAILIWGADPIPYPPIGSETAIEVMGVLIHPLNIRLVLIGLTVMIILHLFFQKTITGISWRGAALDAATARLMGISPTLTMILTFGIGGAVGGAAGALVGPLYFASYGMGAGIGIKAFAAAAIGGFGIVGSMIGGLVLGIVETFAVSFISPGYKDAIAYGSLIIILLIFYKPSVPSGRQVSDKIRAVAGTSIKIGSRRVKLGILAVSALIWLALPFILGTYQVHVICLSLIFTIAALGLQLIIGYTGQISLGHAAFFGVGAYASTLLTLNAGVPFPLAVLLSCLITAGAAAIVAPLLRLTGYYLAMATLALGEIIILLMNNLVSITGGPYGIHGIAPPSLGPLIIDTYPGYYFFFFRDLCRSVPGIQPAAKVPVRPRSGGDSRK